ncbi:uncharacterized protein LOC116268266 [Nymphaea colorata]|uniref:uncharacterized protein LOC116268266 n=1 Tax=Nymphaea colorata TaxID=210225 RepID=UPI00129DFFC7|nr:uncharacterized protein LOC116268266 [Nymphaea colorata]
MKLQSKALGRAAKKAEKEAATYQKKAKEVLKKNNEEAAKMYLMSAAAKTKEGKLFFNLAQNCERTAMKMEFMCGQIKSMRNNEAYINAFSALTQAATQQMGNFDAATMANQMEVFNNKMDEMMINGKMITEIMNTNETQTDGMVEEMKEALQQEIALEEKNKLMEQVKKE